MGTQAQDARRDCRASICSGELSYPQAAELFRKSQAEHPGIEVDLLDYAMERAPMALPVVLQILEECGDVSRLLNALVRAYRHSSNGRMRARIASLLAQNLRSIEWVYEALTDPDPRLRANVIEGIRAWNTDPSVLYRALNDDHHRVVCAACISLVALGDPRGRKMLTHLLRTDRRSEFRAAACWALGKIATPADIDELEELSNDRNPAVRVHARRALKRPDLWMLAEALGDSFAPAEDAGAAAFPEGRGQLYPTHSALDIR